MAVYFDHAATTPMRPEAISAFIEAMGIVGNASSIHSHGQHARSVLEQARESIAETLGADPIEVVFTSGGTEAINLALKGIFAARQSDAPRPIIAVAEGEHHATIESVDALERQAGARAEWLKLDNEGRIIPYTLSSPEETALVTFLAVNNEVGTIQPIAELAHEARRGGVPVHVDAVAAYGHIPISRAEWNVSALSVSAHKIGGPVGIGALVVDRATAVVPQVHGGGQQRKIRSGTSDVAAAVAFAAAARAMKADEQTERLRLKILRDHLIGGIRSQIPEAVLSGPEPESGHRIAANVHFVFPHAQGDSLLFLLDQAGFSVSTGSACTAGVPEPSHVLRAMGRSEADSRSALRFTLGASTNQDDIEQLLAVLHAAYSRARRAGFA